MVFKFYSTDSAVVLSHLSLPFHIVIVLPLFFGFKTFVSSCQSKATHHVHSAAVTFPSPSEGWRLSRFAAWLTSIFDSRWVPP